MWEALIVLAKRTTRYPEIARHRPACTLGRTEQQLALPVGACNPKTTLGAFPGAGRKLGDAPNDECRSPTMFVT
jgi:hypothetical protein